MLWAVCLFKRVAAWGGLGVQKATGCAGPSVLFLLVLFVTTEQLKI